MRGPHWCGSEQLSLEKEKVDKLPCFAKEIGNRAVYTTHTLVDYLSQDVVSLRIRHKQLIRLDLTSAEFPSV